MAGQVGKRKAKMVNEPNDKLRSEMSDRIKEGGGFKAGVCDGVSMQVRGCHPASPVTMA